MKKTKPIKKIIKAIGILSAVIAILFLGGYFIFYYTNIPLPLYSIDKASTFTKSDGKKLLIFNEGHGKNLLCLE